jgi:hypothetical protein
MRWAPAGAPEAGAPVPEGRAFIEGRLGLGVAHHGEAGRRVPALQARTAPGGEFGVVAPLGVAEGGAVEAGVSLAVLGDVRAHHVRVGRAEHQDLRAGAQAAQARQLLVDQGVIGGAVEAAVEALIGAEGEQDHVRPVGGELSGHDLFVTGGEVAQLRPHHAEVGEHRARVSPEHGERSEAHRPACEGKLQVRARLGEGERAADRPCRLGGETDLGRRLAPGGRFEGAAVRRGEAAHHHTVEEGLTLGVEGQARAFLGRGQAPACEPERRRGRGGVLGRDLQDQARLDGPAVRLAHLHLLRRIAGIGRAGRQHAAAARAQPGLQALAQGAGDEVGGGVAVAEHHHVQGLARLGGGELAQGLGEGGGIAQAAGAGVAGLSPGETWRSEPKRGHGRQDTPQPPRETHGDAPPAGADAAEAV